MYSLSELYGFVGSERARELWNGRFAFVESDAERTWLTNRLHQGVGAFSFTLVRRGRLTLLSGGADGGFRPG